MLPETGIKLGRQGSMREEGISSFIPIGNPNHAPVEVRGRQKREGAQEFAFLM